MTDLPATVYKYESFNIRSLQNLKSQSLYFGSPRNFNDPYDCAITASIANPTPNQIEAVKQSFITDPAVPSELKQQYENMPFKKLKHVILEGTNSGLNSVCESFLDSRGVTCFSELNDDLIMWAHYGGQYKGFCLAFDTTEVPFSKLRKVHYVKKIPQIDIVGYTLSKDHKALLDDLFCTKSISWAYEKEWRAIHVKAGTLFGYEPKSLKAIYFGPDIGIDSLKIICLIIQAQNQDVQFFKGKRSKTKFKVEFQKFTYSSHIEAKRKGLI